MTCFELVNFRLNISLLSIFTAQPCSLYEYNLFAKQVVRTRAGAQLFTHVYTTLLLEGPNGKSYEHILIVMKLVVTHRHVLIYILSHIGLLFFMISDYFLYAHLLQRYVVSYASSLAYL